MAYDDISRRALQEKADRLQKEIDKANRATARAVAHLQQEVDICTEALGRPQTPQKRTELESRIVNAQNAIRAAR